MSYKSLYNQDFVKHTLKPFRDADPICVALFKKASFKHHEPITDNTTKAYSREKKDAFVKNRWNRFYQTLYNKSYCQKPIKSDRTISEGVMMTEMAKLFEDDIVKDDIAPLITPTTERVLGYASKDQTRTPLTTYQTFHDRVGYFVIKTNKERIASKSADKYRLSVSDTTPRVSKSRSKSGENISKKKSSTSKINNNVDQESKQVYFVAPESAESQQFTFQFDTKNKNVVRLE